jgi:hypothetical protein
MSLLDLGVEHLNVASYLELSAKITTAGRAGIVFDRYADNTFKFAAIDAATDQVMIGHHTEQRGFVIDAVAPRTIGAGTAYELRVSLKGSTVSLVLDGQVLLGYVFNAATVDGGFGLMACNAATFDDVTVKTDDSAIIQTTGSNMLAAETASAATGSTLTAADLDSAATAAMGDWIATFGDGDPRLAALGGVLISIDDLAGDALAYTEGSRILIDTDAAGHGWFMDGSGSGMDLRSVMTHEVGNLLGIADGDPRYVVMQPRLDAGTRLAISAPSQPSAAATRQPFAVAGESAVPAPSLPPVIDWRGGLSAERPGIEPAANPAPAGWMTDFLNYLGKSKAEREPNAKIKIPAATAKVSPEVTRSARVVR